MLPEVEVHKRLYSWKLTSEKYLKCSLKYLIVGCWFMNFLPDEGASGHHLLSKLRSSHTNMLKSQLMFSLLFSLSPLPSFAPFSLIPSSSCLRSLPTLPPSPLPFSVTYIEKPSFIPLTSSADCPPFLTFTIKLLF